MCGIVGYTGQSMAVPILLQGLSDLEYRGYDSAGVAVEDVDSEGVRKLDVVCRRGKVSQLAHTVQHMDFEGTCGIGHTRWATHGRPTEANAHPHISCKEDFALVHNGIIENFAELREKLEAQGHDFRSETDSEVIVHLVEDAYAELALSEGAEKSLEDALGKRKARDVPHEIAQGVPTLLAQAVHAVTQQLVGSFGLAVVSEYEPGVIVATRKESPIVCAFADGGSFVASDAAALPECAEDVCVLEDGQIAELAPSGISYFAGSSEAGKPSQDGWGGLCRIDPPLVKLDRAASGIDKGDFPDFMLKEIYEQPRVIRDTLSSRMEGGRITIEGLEMSAEELNLTDRVYIIACGTSYHAGLIAKNLIEAWARIPCEVEVASEFRYRDPIITPTTLVVAVSQSGETADTLAAIRDARVKGARVFGITNVAGSPVARESDGVIYTKANKEVAVASTKSFIGQVASLTLLALLLAQAKGKLSTSQVRLLFTELADTADLVQAVLSDADTLAAINDAAIACKDATSALFVGRGMGAATAHEGALKLKEVSYLHAESYAAGEMKHGPIALIDTGFPVIAIATNSPTYDKVVSNLQESRARGAKVVAVATEGDDSIKDVADFVIYVPKVRDAFSPIVASVPLQLFARAVACERGCDVDKPRNLAKSVTVE